MCHFVTQYLVTKPTREYITAHWDGLQTCEGMLVKVQGEKEECIKGLQQDVQDKEATMASLARESDARREGGESGQHGLRSAEAAREERRGRAARGRCGPATRACAPWAAAKHTAWGGVGRALLGAAAASPPGVVPRLQPGGRGSCKPSLGRGQGLSQGA